MSCEYCRGRKFKTDYCGRWVEADQRNGGLHVVNREKRTAVVNECYLPARYCFNCGEKLWP